MFAICWLVTFAACVIGRVCGLGGGVIIKPVLDSLGVMSVATVSFLSMCTVLCMSAWSVGKAFLKKDVELDFRLSTALALGSMAGGLLGKLLFSMLSAAADPDVVGSAQSLVLIAMLVVSLLFALQRGRIKTLHIEDLALSTLIGVALGVVSAFIGGGSGPINMVALSLLFSLPTKAAAVESLYIILAAQVAGIAQTILGGNVPPVPWLALGGMAVFAIIGSELGRAVSRKVDEAVVDRWFKILIVALLALNAYNLLRYLG